MTEKELKNKILENLYRSYRTNGQVRIVISELTKIITAVPQERIYESCKYLNNQKLISCTFLTSNDGIINEVTVEGRSYVEENIIPSTSSRSTISNSADIMKEQLNAQTEDKIYSFFISSTYEDLKEERQAVMAAVIGSGNLPVGMEYFPASDKSQFDYIQKLIDKVDYYILISAGKYGSICEETGASYTEMEYDYAVSKKIPIATFPIKSLDKLTGDKLERTFPKIGKLDDFRKKIMAKKMCHLWMNKDDLKAGVLQSIQTLIKESPRPGWVRANSYQEEVLDDCNLDVTIELQPIIDDYKDLFIDEEELKVKYPKSITLREVIKCLGSGLVRMLPDYKMNDLLKNISINNQNDIDEVIKLMVKNNLIEKIVVNSELQGTGVNYTFTKNGMRLWSSLT